MGSCHLRRERPCVVGPLAHRGLCQQADNLYVEAESAAPILGIHAAADANGAEWGCGGNSTVFGIRGVTRRCEHLVWATSHVKQ